MEEALIHASDLLPNSDITHKIFRPTLHNIKMMGMTMKNALFDKAYGSLRFIPSDFIHGTMRIVVDSLGLGVKTAARSLISLSLQLRDTQKVEKALKTMLNDITTMMATMSMLIAPVVLGITISLQQIIRGALEQMSKSSLTETMGSAPSGVAGVGTISMPKFGDPAVLEALASQNELLLIITVYVIEIVCVLIFFASSVNEGENPLAFKMSLAQALPIAMTIFFVVATISMKFVVAG